MATTATMDMGTEAPRALTRSPHPLSSSAGRSRARPAISAGRVLSIRVESRAIRLLLLLLTLAGAAWMAKSIAGAAIADSLARGATTLAQLERAVAWDPGNPDHHLQAAQAHENPLEGAGLDRARPHLETALRQRPTHGFTWLQLALLLDRQGTRERARQALEMAVYMDRHNVRLRWEAALLALQWGERNAALDHLRYVLAADPERREVAFQLARKLLDAGEPVTSLLPDEPEPLDGLIEAAIRHRDLPLARAAWERRAPLSPPILMALQRHYLDLLLEEGQGSAARGLWVAMVSNGHGRPLENAVWNGGFEAGTLLGWGLDWQVRRVWGVEVGLDRFVAAQGRQSLRLTFNSFPTLDFAGVIQLVAVEPGREYRLRALARALNFTTQSGLKLQVVRTAKEEDVLAETGTVAGTTADWVALETHVRAPADTSLVQVRLRREKAPGPEGNLGGKVWVDEVSLTPIGGVAE